MLKKSLKMKLKSTYLKMYDTHVILISINIISFCFVFVFLMLTVTTGNPQCHQSFNQHW